MKTAWIIACGTELTRGSSVDTNSPWLARELGRLGIGIKAFCTVPDVLDTLVAALQDAARRADIIIITGGLGPTQDDLTRAALAQAAGVELETDACSLEFLRNYFAQRRRDMPEINRVQALLPRGARALPNTCGTAPGVAVSLGDCQIYAMPGVPYEMEAMFSGAVAPELRSLAAGRVLLSRRWRTIGLPEAAIAERLGELMEPGRAVEFGLRAELGEIDVIAYADAPDEPAANAALDAVEPEIHERLGLAVYGTERDSLAGAVGSLLRQRGQTLGTAESCTGGQIGTLITDVPGSSDYFAGGIISYSNDVKIRQLGVSASNLEQFGAVSDTVAREMASGARAALGCDYALSSTGIAGPGGGTAEKPVGLVYVGLAAPGAITAIELYLGDTTPRTIIRHRTARLALDLLRRSLLQAGANV